MYLGFKERLASLKNLLSLVAQGRGVEQHSNQPVTDLEREWADYCIKLIEQYEQKIAEANDGQGH